jgi:uncharacterized membrane protein YczE
VSFVGNFTVSISIKSHLPNSISHISLLRVSLYAFHCLSVGSYEVPLLALVLAILTLLPLQRWVVLETRGSDMILYVTARIILFNYHLTL